ncbi:hypothetical protein ABVT39_017662 [Epinephelus coioides]
MAPVKGWMVGLLLVLLCPSQVPLPGLVSAQDVAEAEEGLHARDVEEVVAEEDELEDEDTANETTEEEPADDILEYRSGSLCSVCSICEHCSKNCDQCPCEDGDESEHCEICQECSSCYICPILCDTICTPGGLVDELSGSLFQTVASFL